VIDGSTQTGASLNTLAVGDNAVLLIELDGTNAGASANGLTINAGPSSVRGLIINRFSSNGISLQTGGGNIIEGNFIGTDSSGTTDLGNSGSGVNIVSGISNSIGGTTPFSRNVISGNNNRGINVNSTGATGLLIQGNYIGTNKNGAAALGNTLQGVFITCPGSSIGGTNAGAGNVISGNGSTGLEINGAAATGNVVAGNLIGTNAAGTSAVPNASSGVQLNNADSNTVGGTIPAARNIISGNNTSGVILNANTNFNIVRGNYIGTDINGTADLGNVQHGVSVNNADNNTVGGATEGERNIIFGNNGHGINIVGASGMLVRGNMIASNTGDGVRVDTNPGSAVLSNSIFFNGGLGIRLLNGANNNQAPPVLTSVSSSGGFVVVQGTVTGPPNSTGTVQFFANDVCDPSGSGEGQIFLGSLPAEFGSSGSTSAPGGTLPGTVAPGQFVTATTTDANNNTSAFSICRAVTNTSFNISGRVLDSSGNGIGEIAVSLNGVTTVSTDQNGNYTFANLAAGGSYTVTPSNVNHSFSPASQTFDNLNVNRVANFVATRTLVSIAGNVTDSNNIGVNNVTLTLTKNGTAAGTVQTDGLGNYSFGNLAVGANYVVTPTGSFTPSSQTFSNLTVNATANFKAAPSLPSQCNTASFAAASNSAVGSTPASVAIGDYNGDGKSDLATANFNSNNVSVLLGSGTGSFSAATNFAVGINPLSVAIGDLNGDGKSDLATANQNSNNVSILLGSGTGNFNAATNFAVGSAPSSVAIGDFNSDGKSDLVTANLTSGNVSILLGSGTGSFSAATNFAVGSGPDSVAIGDFNGDGKSDLAVANRGANVSILLGSGTGSFSAATNFAVGSISNSVAIGDFNGDGKSDLATANGGSNNISILLGSGTGSFSAATNFAVGTNPFSVAAGDFNADGKLDVAVANAGTNNVSIMLGTGAGSFSAPTNLTVGTGTGFAANPRSVAVGDFNSDGKSDLTTANTGSSNVSILLNNGATCNTQGSLSVSGRVASPNNSPLSDVTITLSGPITRVIQTDLNGNYSFPNLVPGGNYAVTVQSPYFVFSPSRADFFNLSNNQTANFTAAPVAVPAPSPPLSDDFTSSVRDPTKWNLGTQTQPAAAVDPQVTTAQSNGQLVISPVSQASGMHYNGYVAANAFDIRNAKATVEVVKAASAGADTLFAIGSDSNNFFRFLVHTAGAPLNLQSDEGLDSLKAMPDTTTTTTPQLIFQVKINGQLTSLSINYDSIQHKFMRFRHEPPAIAPTDGAIVFETSPNNVDFLVQRRILLEKGVGPMTAELSAGTSNPINSGQAVFDNFTLTTSTFQFSSGGYTVGEGDGSVLITVTRAGSVNDAASVDYATADGTAVQGLKYVNATGKLTFAAGQTSKTFSVQIVDNDLAEGNKTVNLMLGNPVSAGFNSPGRAVLNIVDNDTLAPWQPVVLTAGQTEIKTWTVGGRTYAYLKLLFPNAGYRVNNWGQAIKAGNDFTADAAVEKFTGASVQAVTTTAQIYDLGQLANATYNFNFKTSGTLAKTLQFTINSTVPPPNPIDDARQFVKQQYRDFLNREADQAGEDFWTDNITKCNDPARRPPGQTVEQCTLRQRETTSGAFFLSPEFQYTGYFVYRMYQGALGRQPKLSEFIPDAQFVGSGIVVSGQLSGAVINQNKAAFAALFVNCTDATKYRCAEFKAIYDGLSNQQYVDKLFQTTGVNAGATDRTALVNGLNGGTETRATVLQKVVDGINVISEGNQQFTTTYGQAFYNSEFNRAFVELEYFGYMKRDPDEAGYAFWLGKLNQFGGNFVNAEMVLAFISSPEYRARFGQP
jgi:hypothetical protein